MENSDTNNSLTRKDTLSEFEEKFKKRKKRGKKCSVQFTKSKIDGSTVEVKRTYQRKATHQISLDDATKITNYELNIDSTASYLKAIQVKNQLAILKGKRHIMQPQQLVPNQNTNFPKDTHGEI